MYRCSKNPTELRYKGKLLKLVSKDEGALQITTTKSEYLESVKDVSNHTVGLGLWERSRLRDADRATV